VLIYEAPRTESGFVSKKTRRLESGDQNRDSSLRRLRP
jgi:hypothetical protein